MTKNYKKLEEFHLSREYREDKLKMENILHDDFLEQGRSGKIWTKESVLDAIPLEVFPYEISDLTSTIIDDTIINSYILSIEIRRMNV